MRSAPTWIQRTRELHEELAAIAEVDPRWWLVAGAAAAIEAMPPRSSYVISDAAPAADTFIGVRADHPVDPIADAVAAAHATRIALRELDGQLPDQPLAVTLLRDEHGARTTPSSLEVVAFVIGDAVIRVRLADRVEDERELVERLHAATTTPARLSDPGDEDPFVCISIGGDRLTTARHGHRRAWTSGGGPWLGLGRCGGLETVSTCHLAIDGYGHAWLASRITDLRQRLLLRVPGELRPDVELPHLPLVADAVPLGVAWRELPSPAPRALPLAYALGRVLHRVGAKPGARFSPTFQIPIAPGGYDDPDREKRRVVGAAVSVRFDGKTPEPYAEFAARAKAIFARESAGDGLVARLLAATRAAPVPLSFKRRSLSAVRPRFLERIAEVIGGRACLSKITMKTPMPLACAVSSPARMATKADPLGSCVLTILDDGERASITACGSGLAGEGDDAADLIDAVLELHAKHQD